MMSLRAYAKHRGVTPMAVSIAIKAGRLVKCVTRVANGDPKINDAALADQEWDANTDAVKRMNANGGEDFGSEADEPAQPGEGPSLAVENARLKKAQADLAELKFAEAAATLVPANDVERRLRHVFASCKSHLLALPSRVKQALPHLTVSDLDVFDRLLREALTELAEGRA